MLPTWCMQCFYLPKKKNNNKKTIVGTVNNYGYDHIWNFGWTRIHNKSNRIIMCKNSVYFTQKKPTFSILHHHFYKTPTSVHLLYTNLSLNNHLLLLFYYLSSHLPITYYPNIRTALSFLRRPSFSSLTLKVSCNTATNSGPNLHSLMAAANTPPKLPW